MQLRFLQISGPDTEPATVDFVAGLNVINGPSNTGKSYILRVIDYLLGARDAPEPINEQALYDLAHLGIVLDDGTEKTIVRALAGGEIRVLDGLTKKQTERQARRGNVSSKQREVLTFKIPARPSASRECRGEQSSHRY